MYTPDYIPPSQQNLTYVKRLYTIYIKHVNLLYRVARSRLTHFEFEYCAGAIACGGWREGER